MACESKTAAHQAEVSGHLRSSAGRYYYAAKMVSTAGKDTRFILSVSKGILPEK
jgi:hypothetical protein